MSYQQNLRNYINLCKMMSRDEICSMIDNNLNNYDIKENDIIKNVSDMFDNNKEKLLLVS